MSKPAIFIQDACYQHQYIRSKDTSAIVERPERLLAVKIGLAAAIARLEDGVAGISANEAVTPKFQPKADDTEDLIAAMNRVTLTNDAKLPSSHFSITHSTASVDLLNNAAVKFVHGDIDGDVYLENLKSWSAASRDKIATEGSEIPEGLSQGDLYC
jgi:histone deacetylase HOS3